MTINTAVRRAAILAAAPVLAATALAAGVPNANAALYYGAISYAPNGAGASTWNYPTRSDAEQSSLDYCGYTSCKVLSSFSNCGAVAYDGTQFYGGTGRTLALAQLDALSNLGGGWIDEWACNKS
jgi:hypothetical protein